MNFFRRVGRLCAGFAAYRDILHVSLGAAIGYLVTLLALLAVGVTLALLPWLLDRIRAAAAWTDQHLPACVLTNGQLVCSAPQPHRAGDDHFRLVLDTTGTVTAPELDAPNGLLVTGDSLLFWFRPANAPATTTQTQRHPLHSLPDGTINGDYVRVVLHSLLILGVPMALGMVIVGGAGLALLQAALFAWAASFLERDAPGALERRQLLNIAIHAVTPAAIIVAVYTAFRLEGLDYGLIYIVAYGIFLIGASHACRRSE